MSQPPDQPESADEDVRGPVTIPKYQPLDRFWPYVDVPEQPTPEELASLDPDIQAVLFKLPPQPFSVSLVFRRFNGPDYERALEIAKQSDAYREMGSGASLSHRARFFPGDVALLKALFEIVDPKGHCEVLIDDRPVPFARELWLPLIWILFVRQQG